MDEYPVCKECDCRLTLTDINDFEEYCEYCWNILIWNDVFNHILPEIETDYEDE